MSNFIFRHIYDDMTSNMLRSTFFIHVLCNITIYVRVLLARTRIKVRLKSRWTFARREQQEEEKNSIRWREKERTGRREREEQQEEGGERI